MYSTVKTSCKPRYDTAFSQQTAQIVRKYAAAQISDI